ncbi:hypothetical protein GSI_10104 [Ganoderma sinense ZZ0214-1]|uniref:Uncharacterized protein n=1 Tax=Ganoderma sinense ZZ0214-1 TaxID=1077348 RepID=A0A2G8RZM5_9APHY|nr:hypothetical protein GSI_10104 [Ganoderma sinense ZZ0214-1]
MARPFNHSGLSQMLAGDAGVGRPAPANPTQTPVRTQALGGDLKARALRSVHEGLPGDVPVPCRSTQATRSARPRIASQHAEGGAGGGDACPVLPLVLLPSSSCRLQAVLYRASVLPIVLSPTRHYGCDIPKNAIDSSPSGLIMISDL